MENRSFTLDVREWVLAAGVPNKISIPSTFFQVMEATGGLEIDVLREHASIGHAEGAPQGFSFGGPNGSLFHDVVITSTTNQTVRLCFSRGDVDLKSSSGTVEVSNVNGGYTNSRATVLTSGVSVLAAANTSRRALAIQNNSSADYVRVTVDGSAPTAAQGLRLAPGAYWEPPAGFAPTGAVNAIAETGAGAAVEVLEG